MFIVSLYRDDINADPSFNLAMFEAEIHAQAMFAAYRLAVPTGYRYVAYRRAGDKVTIEHAEIGK
jgi:hypothetical protein